MMREKNWRLLRWMVRIISCLMAVTVAAMTLFWAMERELASVYGDTGMVRLLARQLSLSLLALILLLAVTVLMIRHALGTDSWREALSWSAALWWQGVKMGLTVFVALAAGTMLVMGLIY